MAKAALALFAPLQGCNPAPDTAALRHEWSAAIFVWAALPPGSPKEAKVRAHLAKLKARLGRTASASITHSIVDVARTQPGAGE